MPDQVLDQVRWRSVGPFRGGRVVAVAGDPVHEATFYFGACSGGIWKTTNAGLSWENVSDGFVKTASVGALAVAPSDPNVIYAGMGEATIRGNVTHGDGVYRSTDAGRTWHHLGLAESRHIGKVRVHPQNPDIAYVAAFGHAFGPNAERGVYRTTDGGRHWDLVLHRDDKSGAIDLCIDATNPRILYATLWDAQRYAHTLVSGGPGSGIFRSDDGGEHWQEITRNPGLPATGLLGRMGIAASPARAGRVYACIEAEAGGGLFRSDDGGEHWQKTNDDRLLVIRAWYYEHVIADPCDADTVYVLNIPFLKFVDGGRTFTMVDVPHGDNHDLWIDPKNPLRMVTGNDGGACVSLDGGATWSSIYNQPTAQFYHVTTDSRHPYRIYGAQQDNTICTPSRSDAGPITFGDCYPVGGGESGYIAVRQDDPDIVYAGSYGGLITRYDHRSGEVHDITVWPDDPIGYPAKDLKYRFQWTAPIVLSPHDSNVLYATGNHVFRSRDEGQSWERISPDLTRNDITKLGSAGGPITQDNVSTEYYCTIFAFAESPVRAGVLWAGSDDGLVHVSRDAGATWRNVTPPPALLPEWALISIVEASPHDPATAYVAATRYKHDDMRPYLLKTTDYGATWQLITAGIPDGEITRAIREDPERAGLLYAGGESGVYVSFDGGAGWQPLRGNLPVVPVHDLTIKDGDLVAATHGRSFWVLDDLTPLRDWAAAQSAATYLFPPRPYLRRLGGGRFREQATKNAYGFDRAGGNVVLYANRNGERRYLDAGENPPSGVVVQYLLKDKPEGELTLSFLDGSGKLIRRFTSAEPQAKRPDAPAAVPGSAGGEGDGPAEPRVPAAAGLNRFVWNTRYPEATRLPGAILHGGGAGGPAALPGGYTVELSVGGQTLRQPFEIRLDPRVHASEADLKAQFDLQLQIRDRISAAHEAVIRARRLKAQAADWVARAGDGPAAPALKEAADALQRRIDPVEEAVNQPRVKRHADFLNFQPGLNDRLASLGGRVGGADAAPTQQQRDVFADLTAKLDAQLHLLDEIVATDVAALNGLVRESGLAPVG